MSDKPYRPNVGIALFNAHGRVLIARRISNDGPEVIYPGAEWQMPQGGIDANEDPRKAAVRELFEETGVTAADYLGETDWLTYEFPPYGGPPHKLAQFRGQRQKWFAMRFTGDESEHRSARLAQRRGAGIRSMAMGRAGNDSGFGRAVQARHLPAARESFRRPCGQGIEPSLKQNGAPRRAAVNFE